MAKCDIGYAGINFPLMSAEAAVYPIIDSSCMSCESEDIRRIRRITGYLSTIDRFNDAKQAELADRVKHSFTEGTDSM